MGKMGGELTPISLSRREKIFKLFILKLRIAINRNKSDEEIKEILEKFLRGDIS